MSEKEQEIEFNIQRVYVKDISFECPNSPNIFVKKYDPFVEMGIDTRNKQIDDNTFEVILTLTVTAKEAEEIVFLCEIQQAGIFIVGDLTNEQKAHCLNAFCPNILYPYAREAVSSLVSRGTFPQLNIAPVNFDALYQTSLENQRNKSEKEDNVIKLDS
ncbi:MAG: protein-export chaperone SecB [Psychromonas sp.]|nr:protein-export chaperone SecB [Psychromonas sp.]